MGSGEACQLASVDRCGLSHVTATIYLSKARQGAKAPSDSNHHGAISSAGYWGAREELGAALRLEDEMHGPLQGRAHSEHREDSGFGFGCSPSIKQEDGLSIPHPKCLGTEVFQFSYSHILIGGWTHVQTWFMHTLYK